MVNAEMRAAIDWLNGIEGRLWSRQHHFQGTYAYRMFMIKDDFSTCPPDGFTSWGRVDKLGRYRKPAKGKITAPYFNHYTAFLADELEGSVWYNDEGDARTEWDENGR